MKIPLLIPSLILAATLLGCGKKLEQEPATPRAKEKVALTPAQAEEKTAPKKADLAPETKALIEKAEKRDAKALAELRVRAEKGDAIAQSNLGEMYATGLGVAKDEVEAVKWYRKAADQGDAFAQYNLGNMYRNGSGVVKDEVEAVKWYRKAADQGDASGQGGLGWMYADGRGVAKDEVEAYKWWLLAGAQGLESAKKNILLIESDLTAAQRAEGQRLAKEWKPKK